MCNGGIDFTAYGIALGDNGIEGSRHGIEATSYLITPCDHEIALPDSRARVSLHKIEVRDNGIRKGDDKTDSRDNDIALPPNRLAKFSHKTALGKPWKEDWTSSFHPWTSGKIRGIHTADSSRPGFHNPDLSLAHHALDPAFDIILADPSIGSVGGFGQIPQDEPGRRHRRQPFQE